MGGSEARVCVRARARARVQAVNLTAVDHEIKSIERNQLKLRECVQEFDLRKN